MRKWIRAARLFAVGGSILPAVTGGLLAYYETGKLNLPYLFLTAAGVCLLHVGANLINDYFDHVTGADEKNTEGIYPFSGGSRVIQEGIIPAKRMLGAAVLCFSASAAIGAFLYKVSGPWVPVFGIIGLISCILYVSPRISLTKMGLGEFAVGFNLGILLVPGAYYVQTAAFSAASFMMALPVAFTTTLILLVNEFPDYRGDTLAGKRNLVVRLGTRKASHILMFFLAVIPVLIIMNVLLGVITPWALTSLLSLSFITGGAGLVLRYREEPSRYVPAILSVIHVNTFINLYLAVSCLACRDSRPAFFLLVFLVMIYEMRVLAKLHFIQLIREFASRGKQGFGAAKREAVVSAKQDPNLLAGGVTHEPHTGSV